MVFIIFAILLIWLESYFDQIRNAVIQLNIVNCNWNGRHGRQNGAINAQMTLLNQNNPRLAISSQAGYSKNPVVLAGCGRGELCKSGTDISG